MDATTTVELETNLDLIDPNIESFEATADQKSHEGASEETAGENVIAPVTVVTDEEEMNQLHRQMIGDGRTTFMTGMTLGEMLTKKKASLKRGRWGKWVEANLVFDIRMAQNYMNLHKNRKVLLEKYETVAHLGIKGACRMLAKPSKKTEAVTVPDELEAEDVVEDSNLNTDPDETGVALESENGFRPDADTGSAPVTNEIVAELTPEQSAQVLDFIIGVGIDPAVLESLVEHGGMIRLTTTMQEKPSLSSDNAANKENPAEVPNE